MKGKSVLIIDDDPETRTLLQHIFSLTDLTIYIASDGEEGLRLFAEVQPDIVTVDLIMPGINGWTVCHRLRQQSDIPVVILSVLETDNDILEGFRNGAVDFITKPFNPKILLARIRAILQYTSRHSRLKSAA